jgi:uncharacterized phage-associated protein
LRTYSVFEVANYFLAQTNPEKGDSLTNLKLQKLCYYAQGIGCVIRGGIPLFNSRIEAWPHGPVVPELYTPYKKRYGAKPIPKPKIFDINIFDPEDVEILDEVEATYGHYTGFQLRSKTHEEAPWQNAITNQSSNIITPDALKNFFKTIYDFSEIKIANPTPTESRTVEWQPLSSEYKIINQEEVLEYINKYAPLKEILEDAVPEIKKAFSNPIIYLEVITHQDNPKVEKLILSIDSRTPSKEKIQNLNQLRKTWWYDVPELIRDKLSLMLSYR